MPTVGYEKGGPFLSTGFVWVTVCYFVSLFAVVCVVCGGWLVDVGWLFWTEPDDSDGVILFLEES